MTGPSGEAIMRMQMRAVAGCAGHSALERFPGPCPEECQPAHYLADRRMRSHLRCHIWLLFCHARMAVFRCVDLFQMPVVVRELTCQGRTGAGKLKNLIVKHLWVQKIVGLGTATEGRAPLCSSSEDAVTSPPTRSPRSALRS